MTISASRPRRRVLAQAAGALLAAALTALAGSAGCSPETRSRVLVFLFEEHAAPGSDEHPAPVVRSPRHPRPPTPTPTPAAAEAPAAGAAPARLETWDDVMRLLPKDPAGNPDWVGALREKVIAPRPGIAADAAEPQTLALDVDLVPPSDAAFKVVFSHQQHTAWLTCTNCHARLFEMKAGAAAFAPGAAHTARYCGACHGTVAFDIAGNCTLCHLQGLPRDASGRVDWDRALADRLIAPRAGRQPTAADPPSFDREVEFASITQPALKSVFSHATHTRWLACANCHPRLFPEQANAPGVAGADLHSRRYCGACHGAVAFGIIGACGRCHPALEKARQHEQVLDLDVEVPSRSQPATQATFSHKTHRYVECASCHTHFFEMTAEGTKMTRADLTSGKYCALCHGKVAFELIAQCQRCHAPGDIQ